jgi:hypothetical protein
LLKQGLDPRMARGGVVLGAAVYMAESSTKADQYTGILHNHSIAKSFFYTKLLLYILMYLCINF